MNLWGVLLNQVIAMLDAGIAGMATVALAGNYTLTSRNYVADEARNAILKFTGAPATIPTVTIPSVSKIYVIWNTTSSRIIISTGSGATLNVDAGDVTFAICDGTNVTTITFGGLDLKTFITAQTAAAGAVPGTVGALGKFLKVVIDGSPPTWQPVSTLDLSDYTTKILGVQVALAVAL